MSTDDLVPKEKKASTGLPWCLCQSDRKDLAEVAEVEADRRIRRIDLQEGPLQRLCRLGVRLPPKK